MKLIKILIIDDTAPDSFWAEVEKNVSQKIKNKFTYSKTIAAAIEELIANSDYDLILAKEVIRNEKIEEKLQKLMEKHNIKPPIIFRQSPEHKDNKKRLNEIYISRSLELIENRIDEIIESNDNYKTKFVPILAENFLNIEQFELTCDVYIKIKRTGQLDQFIKRLHANDKFTKTEVQKYINAGLKEFYIPFDDYADFINMISIELIKTFKENRNNDSDKFSINSFGYETAVERLKIFMSVDALTIKLVDESIKTMVKSLEKSDSFTAFVKQIKGKNYSFAFAHCYLIAILAEKTSRFFEWNSQQAREKLFFLAFYHDLSLTNSKWTEINSNSELEDANLKELDKILVNNHAALSAELVDRFKDIPFGLSQLIKEHHGSKTGIGFSDSLSINISPMAMVFIVLEDFTTMFLKNNIDSLEEIEKLIIILELKYTKLTYLQSISALRSLLVKPESKN